MTSDLRSADPTGAAERLLTSLFTGDTGTDPYDGYRWLREHAPVFRTSTGTVVLSRFRDVDAALRHRDLGRADAALRMQMARLQKDQAEQVMTRLRSMILFSNPPAHTRLRRLISEAFTRRHVEQLRAKVGASVDEHLERLAGRPAVDFMAEVAFPLPVGVIADLLGVPVAEREGFAPIVRDMADLLEPFADASSLARAAAAESQFAGYLTSVLAAKRDRPQDDLLSRLAASRADDALDDAEMVATAILLFGAGFETTASLLGNALHALLTHPGQLALLRRWPELIPRAVEEFLRFDPPIQLTSRTVLAPCSVAGVELAAGQTVLALLAAAGRDPGRFTEPDRLDVFRDEGVSLSFSTGTHFCLGAHLARLETAECIGRLLRRFPVIELADAPVRRSRRSLRGFAYLPVTATG